MPPKKSETIEERHECERNEILREKFGSRIVFSVEVKRPQEKYPYELTVWESKISVPILPNGSADKNKIEKVVEAWTDMMQAGITLAGAFNQMDIGEENEQNA